MTKKNETKKKAVTKKLSIPRAKVKLGEKVPDFKLEATGIDFFELKNFKNQNIVLYFYPKDSTPGCTTEGHDFTKLVNKFKKLNTVVFGLSRDSLKSHDNFKSKQNYKLDLISDPDEKACGIFGAIKMKKLYGREYRGLDRCTFVIDGKGKLVQEWRGVKVKGHAEEVLEFIKNL